MKHYWNYIMHYGRLDENAENCSRVNPPDPVPPDPQPGDWNGFFLRTDMIDDKDRQEYFGVDKINSGYDDCCGQEGEDKNVISQDQAIGLFLGLFFAKECVPDDAYVQNRVIEIAHAIVNRMHKYDELPDPLHLGIYMDLWKIVNPITDNVVPIGGAFWELFAFSGGYATAATYLTSANYGSEHRSYSDKNLVQNAFNIAQDRLLEIISGTVEISIPVLIHIPGIGIIHVGDYVIPISVSPFNAALITDLSLLKQDWGEDDANNLYEWFKWFSDNTKGMYNMPSDVGIFPQLPLFSKLLWGYEGSNDIPASFYKDHFFDTAPPCGAHNYKDFDGRITKPPWHTQNLFTPWHNYYNGSVYDGDYHMMDYMMMYTAYLGDYYDDPKPYLLVTNNYPEGSGPKKNKKMRLKNKSGRKTHVVQNDPVVIQVPRRVDAINSVFREADVTMKAGQEVHLLPGFHAYNGCNFQTYIDPALDIYPVYFEKTTADPCGKKNYVQSYKSDQMILDQLDGYRMKMRKSINIETVKESSMVLSNKADRLKGPEITIFPNPSFGIFFVHIPENYNIQKIEVFTADGKQIQKYLTGFSENFKINLSNFQSGVYHLKLMTKNGVYNRKLILQ